MPIYEYRCQSCGEETEVLQRLSDDPLVDCPRCGEAAMKKKVSAAAFRLKGGGWYETDFKTGDKKNLAGGGDEGGKSGDTASTGKSDKAGSGDSKPAKSTSSE